MIRRFRSTAQVIEGEKKFKFTEVWLSTGINRKKDLWYIRMEDELVNNVLFITLSRFFNTKKEYNIKNIIKYTEKILY